MANEMAERATPARPDSPVTEALDDVVPGLRARALRLCRSMSDADDLVQDTILRALRFEPSFRRGTNIRAWMHQILMSVFVTRCRRLKRERRALDTLSVDPCAWTRQEAAPVMQSLSSPVSGALDGLPQKFAHVIRLVDLEDLSYREAANHLSVPVGTVMSRLFRGRRMLASALSPPGEMSEAA